MFRSAVGKLKSILVVDDNGINRLLPGLILRPFGWEVYEVEGGVAAIEILKKINISCVLLDLSMPIVGGFDVLRGIRKDKKFKFLKVIAYTAYAQEEDVSRLLDFGFDAVIIKPLTGIKLLEILRNS